MTKTCVVCQEAKPIKEFALNRAKPDGRHNQCRRCKKAYNADYYLRTKHIHNPSRAARGRAHRDAMRAKMVEYLRTHPCVDCGETDIVVLQFDHQGGKLFDISDAMGSPWEVIEREIAKCEVVCANDHMRRTAATFGWYKLKDHAPVAQWSELLTLNQ